MGELVIVTGPPGAGKSDAALSARHLLTEAEPEAEPGPEAEAEPGPEAEARASPADIALRVLERVAAGSLLWTAQ